MDSLWDLWPMAKGPIELSNLGRVDWRMENFHLFLQLSCILASHRCMAIPRLVKRDASKLVVVI